MTRSTLPSVGARDMQDLKGVSRQPGMALLQSWNVPTGPRPKDDPEPAAAVETAAQTAFQTLRTFSPGDYVKWVSEYLRFRFGPRHRFLTYEGKQPSNGIYPLEGDGEEIRIGVAGDWGTGTDEAYRIAQLIAETEPHYTIHLGDVYFVGDSSEVRGNFLGLPRTGASYTPCAWPHGSKASFALNGNHEMYARGFAYFDEILPAMGEMIGGKAQGQLASFFCLKNDDWCILGLDTGYNSVGLPLLEYIWGSDASLRDEVVTWLQSIAGQLDRQAIVIMSHHQVLSVYDDCFTKQADQISGLFKRPVLWLWGHEHRLVLYAPFDGSSRDWPTILGRCIGHGGMPVDLPGTLKAGSIGAAAFVDRRRYHNDEKLDVGINGFAQLTIKGDALRVDYIDVFGEVAYSEHLRAKAGAVVLEASRNVHLSSP